MALRVYNTLTSEKELFVPLVPGRVGMYVCGVTVYDYCHIGHARAGVVFDIIYRYLKYAGYDVTYVRNYTDIDDKIINRANQEGTDYRTIADRYIQAFDEDMARLGLAKPTVEPKATDHIGGIIGIIETLIAKGHAYVSGGDVYYAVETFPDYLKLSGRNLEEMQAGARVEVGSEKASSDGFCPLEGVKTGRAVVAIPLGEWAARLAHRVFGDEHGISRAKLLISMAAARTWCSRTMKTKLPSRKGRTAAVCPLLAA